MQYSFLKSCLLALATASTVIAQATAGFDVFTAPSKAGSEIPAGSTYTIKWDPSAPAGKISIVLLQGSSNITLQVGPTIASAIDSVKGSFEWKVPSDGTNFPVYGLKIQLDSDPATFQYSTYFSITGLGTSSTSGGSATSTVASTTVTVKVSSVPATTSVLTTTLSASFVTISNSSSSSASASGFFPNTTITTATTTPAGTTVAGSATSSAATSTSSSGAMANVAIGGTGLLGVLMVSLGMLL